MIPVSLVVVVVGGWTAVYLADLVLKVRAGLGPAAPRGRSARPRVLSPSRARSSGPGCPRGPPWWPGPPGCGKRGGRWRIASRGAADPALEAPGARLGRAAALEAPWRRSREEKASAGSEGPGLPSSSRRPLSTDGRCGGMNPSPVVAERCGRTAREGSREAGGRGEPRADQLQSCQSCCPVKPRTGLTRAALSFYYQFSCVPCLHFKCTHPLLIGGE